MFGASLVMPVVLSRRKAADIRQRVIAAVFVLVMGMLIGCQFTAKLCSKKHPTAAHVASIAYDPQIWKKWVRPDAHSPVRIALRWLVLSNDLDSMRQRVQDRRGFSA
jgi:hypothetical protein